MHPQTMYELAQGRYADDQRWAARQRLAREAREARFAAHTGESLLERITTALRKAARPAPRAGAGVA